MLPAQSHSRLNLRARTRALLVAILALAPAHARAQCPQGSWNGNPITTATLDQTLYFDVFGTLMAWGSLHLDQAAGQGSLQMGGGVRFGETCGGTPRATMNTADDFVLTGPTSGSPIAFFAVWHLSGNIAAGTVSLPTLPPFCESASADCTLTADAQTATRHYAGCPSSVLVDEDVSLPLSVAAGSHFSLTTATVVQGDCDSHGASLGWQLRFVGLPADHQVTSCWGFATSAPTPVRHTSWGEVKQHYR